MTFQKRQNQAPPPMGFSRQEYWSGMPLPSPMMILVIVDYILILCFPTCFPKIISKIQPTSFLFVLTCTFHLSLAAIFLSPPFPPCGFPTWGMSRLLFFHWCKSFPAFKILLHEAYLSATALDFSLISSVQFSSVTQSSLTLCDPMNCSTPGLPVILMLE